MGCAGHQEIVILQAYKSDVDAYWCAALFAALSCSASACRTGLKYACLIASSAVSRSYKFKCQHGRHAR